MQILAQPLLNKQQHLSLSIVFSKSNHTKKTPTLTKIITHKL